MLLGNVIENHREYVGYLLLAGGAFVGGFIAARESRGSTIIEPAIGAIAVIGTIVGLAAGTEFGKTVWAEAHDETIKLIAGVGGASLVGAIVGAFISEKLFGDATTSSLPWILYTALSVFGACLLALFVVVMVVKSEDASKIGLAAVLAMAGGCLLSGISVGASARTRPLGAAFLGGGVGVAGFFYLSVRLSAGPDGFTHDASVGLAILGGAGAVVTLIGALIGWGAVGKSAA
jgi:hypothetical protein